MRRKRHSASLHPQTDIQLTITPLLDPDFDAEYQPLLGLLSMGALFTIEEDDADNADSLHLERWGGMKTPKNGAR